MAQPMAVDPPPPPQITTKKPHTPRQWYGWQNLALYAATDTIFGVGVVFAAKGNLDASVPLLVLGGFSHMGVGPLVYYIHHGDRATAYIVGFMHFMSPVIGVATARLTVNCGEDKSDACQRKENISLIVGAGSGAVAAMAVDIGFLAFKDRKGGSAKAAPQWTVAPLAFGKHGGGIGFSGEF